MRQTKKGLAMRNLCLSAAVLVFFLAGFAGTALAQQTESGSSPNAAFQDLPKDHWAFRDVDFLVKAGYMEGYPDGNFKGRKVVTRYDVALILARMMKRVEDKRESANDSTEAERAALARLTKEFRDELGLLGVRVDALERRMNDTEARVNTVESAMPKVKVSGFYRGRGQMIFDPVTVGRNEAGDEVTFTKTGLVTFYQQMYLRFTGKPLGDKIETFYELLGFISGRNWNRLVYNDAGKTTTGLNPFDRVDDYVTQVEYQRYAQSNKLHFISNARSAKVRVYAGEAVTGINDPLNLLTEDTDIIEPYQGIEITGTDRGLTYQGQVHKYDIRQGSTNTHEMFAGRLVWKLPAKFSPDALSIGTSFGEKVHDYKIRGNSNAVRAVDVNYTTERVGKVQATAEFLTSTDYHTDTADNQKRNLGDEGSKFDVSMQQGGFTGTLKHYDFGKEFRAYMAPIWAYDIGDEDDDSNYPYYPIFKDNYGHNGFYGEKLTRWSANYDFGNKLLSIAKNLSMEATWLSKTWEVDPFKPQDTDGYSGRKFTYQVLADFTDSTTLKWDFEQKFKALAKSQGRYSNTLELNLKLNDAVGTKAKINVINDQDERDIVGTVEHERNDRTGYFEVNSNINPRVFAKGSVEHQVRWVNAPKEDIRIDYIGETTYNFTPTLSFTAGAQHVDFESMGSPAKSSLANAILGELKKNFTEKFRGRAFYSRGVIDYKDGETDTLDRELIYGELIYDISKDASFKLKFGYDYPNEGRWDISSTDNGRDYKDIHTQKMMIFEAKTNF